MTEIDPSDLAVLHRLIEALQGDGAPVDVQFARLGALVTSWCRLTGGRGKSSEMLLDAFMRSLAERRQAIRGPS